MILSRHIQERWKSWAKLWMPPILLDLYRRRRHSVVPRQFILPVRTLDELFPGIEDTRVSIATAQIHVQDDMVIPLTGKLTLAAICKHTQPRRIFEIGTYTGSSALAMAMNTPSETEIFTLDLDLSKRDTHTTFKVGASFQGTPSAKKIHQLLGNSLTFDYTPFYTSIDLILVDANHTYDFVKVDTENAFKLLRPGGIIIWDDYVWDERHPECVGVTRCLNELRESKPVFQIAGTRFAIYIDTA